METIFKKMQISFDENNLTTISKDKLLLIFKKIKMEHVFLENSCLGDECYILVDKNGKDFYPFPIKDLNEWEKDGSCESGDTLYKIHKCRIY